LFGLEAGHLANVSREVAKGNRHDGPTR
jgi:hypothetical protein